MAARTESTGRTQVLRFVLRTGHEPGAKKIKGGSSMSKARKLRVAIIGAGASGIMSVIKMREAGIDDITVFEKAASLGGTWRDNRYPGLSCDVPSHLYRYSFEPNPEWSHVCSPGPEILSYLKQVVEKHDVARHIRFSSEVT